MLTLSLVLALASGQVAQVCGPGRNCRASSFTATGTNALNINTGALINMGSSALQSNVSGFAVFSPMYLQATNPRYGMFGTASDVGLGVPPSGGAYLGMGSAFRLWRSDNTAWTDVQSGAHPVLDRPTYVVDVGQGAGASEWSYAPRTQGTHVPVTWTEPCTGGTQFGYSNPTPDFQGLTRAYRLKNAAGGAGNTCGGLSSSFTIPLRWRGRFSTSLVSTAAIASARIVCGVAESTLFTAPSDTPAIQGYWFRYSTAAGDTAWQLCVGNGATTCTSTTVAQSSAGVPQQVAIDARESGAVTAWIDGRARVRVTTGLPSGTTNLVVGCVVQTIGGGGYSLGHSNIALEGNL